MIGYFWHNGMEVGTMFGEFCIGTEWYGGLYHVRELGPFWYNGMEVFTMFRGVLVQWYGGLYHVRGVLVQWCVKFVQC